MPQIVIDYSSNLPKPVPFQEIFQAIEAQLVSILAIQPEHIKMRAHEALHYHVGLGRPHDAFLHVDIRLFLEGREAHISALGEAVKNALSKVMHKAGQDLQITVYIHPLIPAHYFN